MNCPKCGRQMIYVEYEPSCLVYGVRLPESPAEWWCTDEECGEIVATDSTSDNGDK